MSKVSIPYWLKKHNGWGGPYEAIVKAVAEHATTGDCAEIAFEGSALELATALYTQYAQKAGAADGLYCTHRHVAEKMAKSLMLKPNDIVLIPGLGLGALYQAVRTVQPEAHPLGVEIQQWMVDIAGAVGMPCIHGDFLDGVIIPSNFTKVLCNPPMGRVFGVNRVECEFLEKIADRTVAGDLVAILLPNDSEFFWKKLLKKHEWLRDAFSIEEEELIANATAPKSITVTRYLLERC